MAILLAAVGVALGLLLLVIPGIYLAVRWFFVPQAVVVENARGPAALRRSRELTSGTWWRTFGIILLANLRPPCPAWCSPARSPRVAESTDRAVWPLVAGQTLARGDHARRSWR